MKLFIEIDVCFTGCLKRDDRQHSHYGLDRIRCTGRHNQQTIEVCRKTRIGGRMS